MKKLIPILDWLPKYQSSYLKGDISAGMTVGVMLIPQGMAYAMIAGLPPVYGLYAAIVPQLIYAMLGTSRQLSVGPVAMDSLLVAAGVSVLATEGTQAYITFAILLAFFMGVFQFLLGTLRLGFITNLLSKPVISGFTSAAAFIIAINQLKHLLGVQLKKSNQLHEVIWSAVQKANQISWPTLMIGIGGILAILVIKKYFPKVPGALLAVVSGILVVMAFDLDGLGVKIVADIPAGLPVFIVPDFSFEAFQQLAPLAMTIAVIAFMEAYSVAKAIESKKREYGIRPNQELMALGLANVIGSMFQSYPVTGGFSRSAVNFQSGAQTQLSSVISAILVGITLLFLTGLFYYLPNAILAAIIMVAVANLIDLKFAITLWKENKVEFALLMATFLVTVSYSMVAGIVTGILLSILVLLFRLAYPHIAQLGRVKGHHEYRNIRRFKGLETWPHVLIFRVDAPLTFINIQYFRDFIEQVILAQEEGVEYVIIDAGPVSHLDATASHGLSDFLQFLKEKEITLLICDIIGPVRDTLHDTGMIDIIGKQHIFLDINGAIGFAVDHTEGQYKEIALQHHKD